MPLPRGSQADGAGTRIRVGIVGATGYVGGELLRLLTRHPNVEIVGLFGRNRDHEPIGGTHIHLDRTGLHVERPPGRRRRLPGAAPRGRRGDRARARRERAPRSSTWAPTSASTTPPTIPRWYKLRPPARRTSWRGRLRPAGAPPGRAGRRCGRASRDRRRSRLLPHRHDPGARPPRARRAHRRPRGRRQERRVGRRPRAQAGPDVRRGQRERQGLRHRRPPPRGRDGAGARGAGAAAGRGRRREPGRRGGRLPAPPHPHDARHPVRLPRPADPPGHPGASSTTCTRRPTRDEPFVQVVAEPPATKHVLGSNICRIHVTRDERTGRILAIGVIDNLVKGAAGQAVQAFNVVYGLPETAGLEQLPLAPVADAPTRDDRARIRRRRHVAGRSGLARTRRRRSSRRSPTPARRGAAGRLPRGLPRRRPRPAGIKASRAAGPRPHRHHRRPGLGRRRLHHEPLRRRARPALAGAPRDHPPEGRGGGSALGARGIVATSGCANAATGARRLDRPGDDRRTPWPPPRHVDPPDGRWPLHRA